MCIKSRNRMGTHHVVLYGCYGTAQTKAHAQSDASEWHEPRMRVITQTSRIAQGKKIGKCQENGESDRG